MSYALIALLSFYIFLTFRKQFHNIGIPLGHSEISNFAEKLTNA